LVTGDFTFLSLDPVAQNSTVGLNQSIPLAFLRIFIFPEKFGITFADFFQPGVQSRQNHGGSHQPGQLADEDIGTGFFNQVGKQRVGTVNQIRKGSGFGRFSVVTCGFYPGVPIGFRLREFRQGDAIERMTSALVSRQPGAADVFSDVCLVEPCDFGPRGKTGGEERITVPQWLDSRFFRNIEVAAADKIAASAAEGSAARRLNDMEENP